MNDLTREEGDAMLQKAVAEAVAEAPQPRILTEYEMSLIAPALQAREQAERNAQMAVALLAGEACRGWNLVIENGVGRLVPPQAAA